LNKKKIILSLSLLVLVAISWHLGKPSPPQIPTTGTTQAPAPSEVVRPALSKPQVRPSDIAQQKPRPETLSQDPSHPLAVSFGSDIEAFATEPALLMEIFNSYRSRFGAFPSGEDNPQIMNALMGANPARLPIFPLSHPRLSETGALLDAWKSPFFFHLISSAQLEIRSAGPDREIYTDDDIVVSNRPDEDDR